jgi:ribosomal protein S18 acetylase RimI-like enzyme
MFEKNHPKEPRYYLYAIGTKNQTRGTGLGSALMRLITSRCDVEGIPAYLENTNENNLPFYAKHGFKIQKEIKFSNTGPKLWFMWREPR